MPKNKKQYRDIPSPAQLKTVAAMLEVVDRGNYWLITAGDVELAAINKTTGAKQVLLK